MDVEIVRDASVVPTRYWSKLEDGRIQCDLCPRFCRLREGQRGLCFVCLAPRLIVLRAGILEGQTLGLEKGRELGHELGFYAGCAECWCVAARGSRVARGRAGARTGPSRGRMHARI